MPDSLRCAAQFFAAALAQLEASHGGVVVAGGAEPPGGWRWAARPSRAVGFVVVRHQGPCPAGPSAWLRRGSPAGPGRASFLRALGAGVHGLAQSWRCFGYAAVRRRGASYFAVLRFSPGGRRRRSQGTLLPLGGDKTRLATTQAGQRGLAALLRTSGAAGIKDEDVALGVGYNLAWVVESPCPSM